MARRYGVLALAVVAAGAGGAWYLTRDPVPVQICEGFVKDTLMAPETYRREAVDSGRLDFESPADKALAQGMASHDFVSLRYTAENRMGQRVRDVASCRFDFIDGKPAPERLMRDAALFDKWESLGKGSDFVNERGYFCCDVRNALKVARGEKVE